MLELVECRDDNSNDQSTDNDETTTTTTTTLTSTTVNNDKKRKRNSVDIATKLKALDDLNNGKKYQEISEALGVGVTTVKSWKKNELSLRTLEQSYNDKSLNKKRLRGPENERVEEATWLWFNELRNSGKKINKSTIKSQALFFWQRFDSSYNFDASDGWLTKWKIRHGIKTSTTNCGKLTANHETSNQFIKKLSSTMETDNLTKEQIFTLSSVTLNYRELPKKQTDTFDLIDSLSKREQKITIIACLNGTGTIKLPLLLIGKYAKPKTIKDLPYLPVMYRAQKNAWLTSENFNEWFHNEFIPHVTKSLIARGQEPRALLLLDNTISHSKLLSTPDFKMMFYPINTNLLIQPLDQGCLQYLKIFYRKKLCNFIIDQINRGVNFVEALKAVATKEVIFWLSNAWEMLDKSAIVESWKVLWPETNSEENSSASSVEERGIICLILKEKFLQVLQTDDDYKNIDASDVDRWLNTEHLLLDNECLSDDEVIEIVNDYYEAEKANNACVSDSKKNFILCTNKYEKLLLPENGEKDLISSETARRYLDEIIDLIDHKMKENKNKKIYSVGDLMVLRRIRDSVTVREFNTTNIIDKSKQVCEDNVIKTANFT